MALDIFWADKEIYGTCFVFAGDEVVITDPGMAYYQDRLVEEIRRYVGDRKVTAVLLTHSHYDHIAAVPGIRKAWPEAKVYGAAYVQDVLRRPGARATMRRLSEEAADINGIPLPSDYDASDLSVDCVVSDGQILHAGDIEIQALEMKGHTKDSFSFLIDGKYFVSSESLGILVDEDFYFPSSLVSFSESRRSILRSSRIRAKKMTIPHVGIVDFPGPAIWDRYLAGLDEAVDFMGDLINREKNTGRRLKETEEKYWKPAIHHLWPQEAFDLNAIAMFKAIEKEQGIWQEKAGL